ncbi:hypothetical protein F0562_034101 [Nyssa sinensis]|uniref:Response regulatory domain-containing protein n=1 Tax=Nyssa sinensis TaxID=561372 RepID=A0A5J5AEV3_9ASTE|nr:hypothetical protein F0562_034101 [Nyssa sinensis]
MDTTSNLENYLIPTAARGLRVLLVDHDTTSLMHIASVLEEQFYKVRTTELASVALSMIWEREDQFDLVMADINMPEMDIFTFLKRILLKRDMPIILMSFGENMDMAKKALNEGACFFLQKPLRTQDLISVWQHVYRKRRWRKMERQKTDSEKKFIPKKVSRSEIVEMDSACMSPAKYELHDINENHLQTGMGKREKKIRGEGSLVEGNGVRESQNICKERLMTVEKGNERESKKIQEMTRENDSCSGKIGKVDGVSRVTGGNDLHGINNENLATDTRVKNLRNQGECIKGSQYMSMECLMTIEKRKHGESKRKRVNVDEDGKKSEEKSNLGENNSKGMISCEEKGRERKEKHDSIIEKKSRMTWTPELHLKFMEAVSVLGEKKAHPKAVLEMMKVPKLTHRHVASHLQKYRDRVKRISESIGSTTPSLPQSNMSTSSTYKFFSGNGFPQRQEQHNSMKNPQGLMSPKPGIGAATKQFIPTNSSAASSKLHVGSSATLNYADLFTNLTEKTHSYQTNHFNKNQVASSTKLPGLAQIRGVSTFPNAINWSENGKGKQPLEFNVCAENFSYVTPPALLNQHQQLDPPGQLNASRSSQDPDQFPMAFPGLTQKTDFIQGQICSSSTSNANIFPTDHSHDANQEPSSSLHQKQPSVDYTDLIMGKHEVFNGELNAADIDCFSEWLETPPYDPDNDFL